MSSDRLEIAAPLEIGYCVADLERSLRFYRDFLGLAFVSEIDTPAEFAVGSGLAASAYRVVRLQLPGGERLKLFAPLRAPEPARRRADPPPLSAVGYAFLTLIVPDIERLIAKLARNGIRTRPPGMFKLRQNTQIALVEDPDGNVIELVQYGDLSAYRSDLGAKAAPNA